MEPGKLIIGSVHKDIRGSLVYFKDFNMESIRRCYLISPSDENPVRAWQGHKKECKWFHVIEGTFEILLVIPDDWRAPSSILPYERFVITALEHNILYVPGGYVNGFKPSTPNAKMLVYSNFSLTDSQEDDFRFSQNLWYKW